MYAQPMDLLQLPKCELHLHMDCSLSYDFVRKAVPGLSRDEYARSYRAPARCTGLPEFLARAASGVRLLQTEDSLRLAVEDLFMQLAADGLIYAEVRFAPLLHLEKGLLASRVVEVVERAAGEMAAQTGIEVRFILCTLRHYTREQSMETARLVHDFQGSVVTALDIAGDEAGFPLDPHVPAFDYAHAHGLHCTAHAGEACGPASVWETLKLLKPTRIGHGVRSVEDGKLVEHLREKRVHLEVCPSSNVQIVPEIASWPEHPIDKLYRAGVRLNVNTDTRTLTPITLTAEYERLHEVFGWMAADFAACNRMAVEAAFVDDVTREKLLGRLQTQAARV